MKCQQDRDKLGFVRSCNLFIYNLVKRLTSLVHKKNITLTFDAFVDQMRGLNRKELETKYPSYKIDKRLMYK